MNPEKTRRGFLKSAGMGVAALAAAKAGLASLKNALPRWRGLLGILKIHGIGWALWEFRGSFGVLDSERADVAY